MNLLAQYWLKNVLAFSYVIEEEPTGEKGSRGRKKVRESIRAVNVSKHIL